MKFCYCPECDKLRPSNWYARDKCEICSGKCMVFRIKRTILGYLMYALDIIALVFIVLYLTAEVFPESAGEALRSLGTETVAVLIFVLVGASLVFAYFDIKETTRRAEEYIHTRIEESRSAEPDERESGPVTPPE